MKIVFTGDVMPDRGVNDQLRLHGDSLLLQSFNFLQDQDFLIVNLEGVLTDSETGRDRKYNFKTHPSKAALLKDAGITHVSIANNHIFDYGKTGYDNTIKALEANNLNALGHLAQPSIIQKGTASCAVLSASLTTHNEALPISTIDELKASITAFTEHSADMPLVLYIHWGLELQPVPEKWQTDLARELIDLGVDAIIGHHPHVTQTMEFVNNKPVFYSLGNFIADAYLPDTDLSYVVELDINNTIEAINIIPVQLKRYFPEPLLYQQQIPDLQKHVQYSSIGLYKQGEKWAVKPSKDIDFSENTDTWMLSSAETNTVSTIKKLNDDSFLLSFQKEGETANVLNLHGKLSEYHVSDINNNGDIDILVGIDKKVKFDPIEKKRINIYTFRDNALEPLWLGTKFINDIVSFSIINHNNRNYLATVEITNENEKVERVYEWDDFGFALTTLNTK